MKDSEGRGLVLKHLYDLRRRNGGWLDSRGDFGGIPVAKEDLPRLVEFLVQQNYANWKPLKSGTDMGVIAFMARITAAGSDVIEGVKKPPASITFDFSVNVHGSHGAQVVGGQGNTVSFDVEKLINAIDRSEVSVAEREKAKGIIAQIAGSPLVQTLLGIVISTAAGTSSAG